MATTFTSDTVIDIDLVETSVNRSAIVVENLDGLVEEVEVSVRLEHSYTRDVVMILESPAGERVLLVSQQGGSGNNFEGTTFDDDAARSIKGAAAPFVGSFRPEAALSAFRGTPANGRWTLLLADNARYDGGKLLGWDLKIRRQGESTSAPVIAAGLPIEIRFLGGLTQSQERIFSEAAAQWSSVIRAGGPPVIVNGDLVEGVRIDAQGVRIDGASGILGQASPELVRPGTFLPAQGRMQFDTGDLTMLEANGGLTDVILHEMGHVLGIGTLWSTLGLISGSGTANPVFIGQNAQREFARLVGAPTPRPVPVENRGGPGTREGHWRDGVFGNELMTSFLDPGNNPLSRLTGASLVDLGYDVDLDAVEAFRIPSGLEMAIMGIGSDSESHQCCTLNGGGNAPAFRVLSRDAVTS